MAARPRLTIGTFNLYNLQVPGESMYYDQTYTEKHYEAKIAWTASILRRMKADVIGFQELWHPDALRDAFDAAELSDEYNLVTKNFGKGIGTALAVKKIHTVERKKWQKKFPRELVLKKRQSTSENGVPDYEMAVQMEHFSRDVLRAEITPQQGAKKGPTISFYVAHLKSKLPIPLDREERNKESVKRHAATIGSALATIRRTAEAAALRVMLSKEMRGSNTPVVVMGDLNDTEFSVTNTIITGDPSYRLHYGSRAGSRSDIGLYSASSLQEYRRLRSVNFTHEFKGRLETLDHILVSQEFYDYSKKRVWAFREMRVLNDHLGDGDKTTGDHGVVTATFDYYPAKKTKK